MTCIEVIRHISFRLILIICSINLNGSIDLVAKSI